MSENHSDATGPVPWRFVQRVLIVVGITALSAVGLALLWQGAEIGLLVFAGLLLAIVLRSLGEVVSKVTRLPSDWAVVVVVLAIAGVTTLAWTLLAPSVEREFADLTDQLPAAYEQARTVVSQYPLGRRVVDAMPAPESMVFGRQSGNILGRVTGVFSSVLDVVVNLLIVLMIAAYFAFRLGTYREGLVALVPPAREARARQVLSVIHYTLQRFLLGISGSMAINGILTGTGLWLLGIPFAVPLGIIAGVMSFVPNIGPLVAGVPAVLIAVAQGPTQGIYVLLLYLAVQNIDGYVITPLIQQRAASIPPVLLIASQLLLAVTFGLLGLLLAVPLTAVVFVAVKMLYVEDALGRVVTVKGERKARLRTPRT